MRRVILRGRARRQWDQRDDPADPLYSALVPQAYEALERIRSGAIVADFPLGKPRWFYVDLRGRAQVLAIGLSQGKRDIIYVEQFRLIPAP